EPVKEISQWVNDLQFPYRQKRRGTKQYAKNCIRNKWPNAYKELRREIIRALVDHVTRRVLKLKKANVVHLQPKQPAEEKMDRFMHDHAGERQHRNHDSGNEKHLPYFTPFSPPRNFLSYSCFVMTCRESIR